MLKRLERRVKRGGQQDRDETPCDHMPRAVGEQEQEPDKD